MSEQTNPNIPAEDITETTAAAEIELQEEDLNRVSGGSEIKFQPFK